uniref:Thioredoxin n=1 Tax=Fervidicoccus fontis TaxID=683846 RepID=A0A7J3ZL84_9CREN
MEVLRVRALVLAAGALLVIAILFGYIIALLSSVGGASYQINTEGVFIFENGKWKRVVLEGMPWIPADERVYIVYFRNLQCYHCQRLDPIWIQFVQKFRNKPDAVPVEIVCTWFEVVCRDPTAKASFSAYGIKVTPTLLVIYNKTIVNLHYGVLDSPEDIESLISEGMKNYYNQTGRTG